MPFRPPEPLPESEKLDSIEINPIGGITEYVHPKYRDEAPKTGTDFDGETEEIFRSLDSFYKLDYEEQEAILNDFFRPYIIRERFFQDRLRDPKTAPRTLELLRRVYVHGNFGTITEDGIADGKRQSSYIDSSDFSHKYLTLWITKSLHDLDRELERTDLDEKALRRLRTNVFYVVSEAQNTGDSQARQRIDEWISRHDAELESIDPFFWEPSDDSQDQMALYARQNFFLHAESGILAKQHLDSLMRLRAHATELGISQEVDRQVFRPILIEPGERHEPVFELRQERLAQAMAAQFDLNPAIVDKWREAKVSLGNDRYRESYWNNLEAAGELEASQPGSAKKLYETYRIANFGRYETDMLLRQLEMADTDTPYGVIVYPEADHNGAFFQNSQQLYDASLQLRVGGFETRIVEAGSQRELARRLLRLHKKYSPAGNKFSFAIVGGHGSPNSVALGNEKSISPPPLPDAKKTEAERERELEMWRLTQSTDTGSFETSDLLEGDGINRALEEWFESNAPKVLVSCSTGAKGGIAERASTQTSGEVIAPKIPTNVKKIEVTFDGQGKPVFAVEYSEGTAARYAAGQSK